MAEAAPSRSLPRALSITLAAAGLLLILGNGLCATGAILAGPGYGSGFPDAGLGFLIFGMVTLALAAVATLVAWIMAMVKGAGGAKPTLLVLGSLGLDLAAIVFVGRIDNAYPAVAMWVFAIVLAVTALGALRRGGAFRHA